MLVTLNLCADPPPLRKKKMRAGGSEGGGGCKQARSLLEHSGKLPTYPSPKSSLKTFRFEDEDDYEYEI